MTIVIDGHRLGLLVATISASSGHRLYDTAVIDATRLLGKNIPSKYDLSQFQNEAISMSDKGLIKLSTRDDYTSIISYRRGLYWSTKQPTHKNPFITPVNLGITTKNWSYMSEEEQEHQLGLFATAVMRDIVSKIAFLLSKHLSERQTSNALKHLVPPSLTKALRLRRFDDKIQLINACRALLPIPSTKQSSSIVEDVLYSFDSYPPSWTYEIPKPGREQLETVISVAEVMKLANECGLTNLSDLRSFKQFLSLIKIQ